MSITIKEKLTIGIIGGTGEMGTFFRSFFEENGHTVLIQGRRTELTLEECIKQSDVVMLSVPIDATVPLIKEIGHLFTEEQLICDITSLKIDPIEAMLNHTKAAVLGMHPVFGPGVPTITKQAVVLCPGRGDEWLDWFSDLFKRNGANVKVTSAAEHDSMMAIIQGLMHFSTISIAHVLKELNIDVDESMAFSSPIYKLRLSMVGRILNQDPSLYANIEIMNSETLPVLRSYLENCYRLLDLVKQENSEGFIDYFKEASNYLGDFKERATDYSNYVINKLVDRDDNQ
jgi:prephenate dehydrogenase